MSKTTLSGEDQLRRCMMAAERYLVYRPRSESELREKLRRRGFEADAIESAIGKLKLLKFVDDVAFAEFWKDNRESFSPRSKSLTRLELRQKGLADEIIDNTVAAIDDAESAYRAAEKKARTIPREDYDIFRRRLGSYLQRRGFNYGVIERTVKRIWQDVDSGRK